MCVKEIQAYLRSISAPACFEILNRCRLTHRESAGKHVTNYKSNTFPHLLHTMAIKEYTSDHDSLANTHHGIWPLGVLINDKTMDEIILSLHLGTGHGLASTTVLCLPSDSPLRECRLWSSCSKKALRT